MKKTMFWLLIAVFAFSGCEKDDICDGNTPTTPRLVIEFYDFNNPAVLKTVPNLRIVGEDMTEPLQLSSTNKIQLPLKTTEDKTQYSLTVNYGNSNPALVFTDTLDFNYLRTEQYISRACGFKTRFTLNAFTDPLKPVIINNDASLDQGSWIRDVQILTTNIETENETHIKIFF